MAAARIFREGAQLRGSAPACRVDGCGRPLYASGLCGFHALQGYYRTVPGSGGRLAAARVARPPRVLLDEAAPEAG
ncbi:MAG TPA: hypothetical protein VMK42_05615 [Anaeromyxobacteraceae bacterium]|nr:hypothetical protein [Anaeromyxobacteraceae bacterium]